jgi:hypothetical protein
MRKLIKVKAMEIIVNPMVSFCEDGNEQGFLNTGSFLAG